VGHIEREMERDGEMLGTLANSAFFNFTDSNVTQPILSCQLQSNATIVNQGDDLLITRIITNVGNEPAFNVDFVSIAPDLISVDNFDIISGNITQSIAQLNPGQSTTETAVLRCNHNENRSDEYQFYMEYDAIANPSLANHWSEPQFDGDRYQKSSNVLSIFHNDVENYPWMLVNYEISAATPQVGDDITISATIKNMGETDAENIEWQVRAFPDYGYSCDLGINLTADSGIIPRLNSGASINLEINYTVDAYNRYFGGICEFSIDLQYDEIEGTQNIIMDSDNFYANDAGSAQYVVLPKQNQDIGPTLNLFYNIDMTSNQTGTTITLDCSISNNGTSPAYNTQFMTSYRDGDEVFYTKYLSGIEIYPYLSLGVLQPGETVHFSTRFVLLENVESSNFSINPLLTYTIHEAPPTYGAWNGFTTMNQYQTIIDDTTPINKQATVWMIIAFTALTGIVIESVVLYRKIKIL